MIKVPRLTPKYKWIRQRDKEWLRFLIENELIVKVHAYRKKNPSYCVDPRDIKTNIKRYPIGHFESLRKKGAFYEPVMSGDWYLFVLRDDVKEDMSIFRDDLFPTECLVIKLCRQGKEARRTRYNNWFSFKIFDGDEIVGSVEHGIAERMIENGWFVERKREGETIWYDFVDLDA